MLDCALKLKALISYRDLEVTFIYHYKFPYSSLREGLYDGPLGQDE